MHFNPDWSVSDIANFAVAAGTLAMAWYTGRAIKETRQSIKAAEQSAAATEESTQRMKDALMPYLSLDITSDTGGFVLQLRNVGGGLAIIRMATVRKDVQIRSVLDDAIVFWEGDATNRPSITRATRLQDFVVAAGESFSFLLESSQEFSRDQQHDWLSSLSIYYEDVYERKYRSRLLYLHERRSGLYGVRSIGTEHFAGVALPVSPISNFNIEVIRNPEGSIPHIYRPSFRAYYRLSWQDGAHGRTVKGTSFTQGHTMSLLKVEIPYHGYPEFHLQIGSHIPFALTMVPIGENGQISYYVGNVYDSPHWSGSAATKTTNRFSEHGLVAEGNDGAQVQELYEMVRKQLMSSVDEE